MPPPGGSDRTTDRSDAADLVLREIERVVDAQLENFKALTSRAGTVLSVLIGSLTATLTLASVLEHPPFWAVAIPAGSLVGALVTSCLVFHGSEVTTGPRPESLLDRVDDDARDVKVELVNFYVGSVVGSPAGHGDSGFVGNRALLHRKQRLFELSVVLLALTVVSLVGVALALYA